MSKIGPKDRVRWLRWRMAEVADLMSAASSTPGQLSAASAFSKQLTDLRAELDSEVKARAEDKARRTKAAQSADKLDAIVSMVRSLPLAQREAIRAALLEDQAPN